MLIDTHAHLYVEEFNEDRTAMVERAIAAGVEKMLMPAIDSSEIDALLALLCDDGLASLLCKREF
jgi:TatD DNase family protein